MDEINIVMSGADSHNVDGYIDDVATAIECTASNATDRQVTAAHGDAPEQADDG